MKHEPTGRLEQVGERVDLVLERRFRAPIEDVWASVTESERTARWFGSWTGEGGPGRTISLTMTHEQGAPSADVVIEACEPPHRLALRTPQEWGGWHLELHLSEEAGETVLRFSQHVGPGVELGSVGPGWEYYLDNLVAAREARALPTFEEYYPAQQEYYRALTAAPTS